MKCDKSRMKNRIEQRATDSHAEKIQHGVDYTVRHQAGTRMARMNDFSKVKSRYKSWTTFVSLSLYFLLPSSS